MIKEIMRTKVLPAMLIAGALVTISPAATALAASPDQNVCKNGGWQDFLLPHFKNQGDCVSYFATNSHNSTN